ncbi:MAG: cytosine permease [Candidatus Obscuribacterales bacterium]|nr:cytosine permease [Candidatus Obscuribacterales bacterium]
MSESAKAQDYANNVVPLSERRGAVSMALLWLTMSVTFPSVMAGFDWYKEGLSLSQVISGSAISCLILTVYATCAAWLGAYSGQTWGVLARRVFGRWGARFVSCNLIWLFVAFYSLFAALLAQGVNGMFHTPIPTIWLAAMLAIAMCVNNVFGFSGVVNFARFLVAPVMILWVALTASKVIAISPADVWSHQSSHTFSQALTMISSYILGLGLWGNEPDFWRFAKPKAGSIAVSLLAAFAIGLFLFPITGWLLANLSHVTDYGKATELVNSFAFGPIAGIAALIMTLNYFACNDSNLYGAITTLESIVEFNRQKAVFILTAACTALSMWLTTRPDALGTIFSINGFLMSTPTVLMFLEFVVLSKIFRIQNDFTRVIKAENISRINIPGVTALAVAYIAGFATAGVIPGTTFMQVGICPVHAWIAGIAVYCLLRIPALKKATIRVSPGNFVTLPEVTTISASKF